jgi:dihydrofolate reductase
MGENRVIGNQGALPWTMPADLAHFKAVTLGKPVIMGLNTYRAIGRLLPGRKNIILSHAAEPIEGAVVAHSIDEALIAAADVDEACIIGGQRVFEQFLPLTNRIELTVIHASPVGDTFFPELLGSDWHITNREEHSSDERNKFDYTFLTYERAR